MVFKILGEGIRIVLNLVYVKVPNTRTPPRTSYSHPAMRTIAYGGYTLRSEIEAPLITREVLPETYFLLVIMAADAQAGPFLQFQASCCVMWNLVNFWFPWQLLRFLRFSIVIPS